jgi:energy-coupling factor transporter ATP-binding protein EcfA2
MRGDGMNFGIQKMGQFSDVSVEFGDFTLLVGAQGTGKSIFLQMFKLLQDQDYVKNTMNQFGQDWSKQSRAELLEAYFGEGMRHMWSSKSRISRNGKNAVPRQIHWVAPGRCDIRLNDSYRRQLALAGVGSPKQYLVLT